MQPSHTEQRVTTITACNYCITKLGVQRTLTDNHILVMIYKNPSLHRIKQYCQWRGSVQNPWSYWDNISAALVHHTSTL